MTTNRKAVLPVQAGTLGNTATKPQTNNIIPPDSHQGTTINSEAQRLAQHKAHPGEPTEVNDDIDPYRLLDDPDALTVHCPNCNIWYDSNSLSS